MSTGMLLSCWLRACHAAVSAPMLMPAKKVDARLMPSKRTMNSRQERTSRLNVYENDKLNQLIVSRVANFNVLVQVLNRFSLGT